MPKIEISPTDAPIGAEISGVDLSQRLDDATFAEIEAAFDKYSVLFFRGQELHPQELVAFSERFGAIEINAFNKFALPDHPGVLIVSNIKQDGRDIGYADAGSHWHTDMSYTARPPRMTMLYALEVPYRDGEPLGDTVFASAAAAYDALDAETKAQIEGLRAIHRFAAKQRGVKAPVALTAEQIAQHPDVEHPVARTHPKTGRKALYVRAGECVSIPGMADSEALPLIERLSEWTIRDEFRYRHRWRAGDVLMWDNAAVQHWAPRDYEWPERRLMHRTTVNGSVPF